MKPARFAASVAVPMLSICLGCGFRPDLETGLEAYRTGNWATAKHHLEPIAEKGDADAQLSMGMMYSKGSGVPKDLDEAKKWLQMAAEQGLSEAKYRVAQVYSIEDAPTHDPSEAKRWYLSAAEDGHVDAQIETGKLLLYEKPLEDMSQEELEEGFRWLKLAIDTGSDRARYSLGYFLHWRAGSPETAMPWMELAAENGYAPAQLHLGHCYSGYLGLYFGVALDVKEAAKWYQICAEAGEAECQHRLGQLYHCDGRGCLSPDSNGEPAKAAIWYRMAADQNDEFAQLSLGKLYINGEGVPQDFGKAAELLRRSADQGNNESQILLGLLFSSGKGVPKDFVRAHMWLNLGSAGDQNLMDPFAVSTILEIDLRSAVSHFPSARELRDAIAEEMTNEQIAQAQSMASGWKPSEPDQGSESEDGIVVGRTAATGTGFRINPHGHILTNHHVVNECSQILAAGIPVQVVASDAMNDLAVLIGETSGESTKFARADNIKPGTRVVAAGFPLQGVLGSGLQTTSGELSALSGVGSDTRYFQVSVPINPGSSGGPLFDPHGLVAGVVTARLDDISVAKATGAIPQNVGFALKASVVRAFLDANNIEYSTGGNWLKKDPEDIAERALEVVVLVACQN